MKKTKTNTWGVDTATFDTTVRPQDDFFHYVNGSWIKNTQIPDTESRWGNFHILRLESQKQLRTIVDSVNDKKHVVAGSPEQLIRDLYLSGMDLATRNAVGITPLTQWMNSINRIKDTNSLLACIAALQKIGIDAVWGFGVDQDSKRSNRYLLLVNQGGLSMPDRDYYLKDDSESVRVRTAFKKHVENIFKLVGYDTDVAEDAMETVLGMETEIAKVSMTKEDLRDPYKTYNKKSVSQLKTHTPNIHWDQYLKNIGAAMVKDVNMRQPDFFASLQQLLESITIDEWKTYLRWQLISGFSPFLTQAFERENFNYEKALTGAKKPRPQWRKIVSVINGGLGELLGQLYVKKFFSHDSKKMVEMIVADLFAAYENRIKKLDWMSDATKKKALKKLSLMTRKIGYPDSWRSYKGLSISPTDYVGNIIRITSFEHKRDIQKLVKAVDRSEWFMNPQTVNAYFAPMLNDIVFPAAILQSPFFSLNADAALNYGGIGSVIGHEITHGFDDEGAQYDGNGNLRSWWLDEDVKKFNIKTRKIEKQFDAYTVADGIHVNGKLTLGENTADLGGLSIAYDAYQLYLDRSNREVINELTPEQRFFIGYAKTEREKAHAEVTKMQVLTDPHSPALFRTNGPLSNMPEFYAAFGVKKGDGMYKDPAARAKVW